MLQFTESIDARKFLRFAIVGCSNAVVGYLVFATLMQSDWLPRPYRTPLCQTLSYLAGVAWAFFWHRSWAFRDSRGGKDSLLGESARFVVVQAACMLLSIVLVTLLIDQFLWQPALGWLFAMSVVTAVNFLAIAVWVFPGSANLGQK